MSVESTLDSVLETLNDHDARLRAIEADVLERAEVDIANMLLDVEIKGGQIYAARVTAGNILKLLKSKGLLK